MVLAEKFFILCYMLDIFYLQSWRRKEICIVPESDWQTRCICPPSPCALLSSAAAPRFRTSWFDLQSLIVTYAGPAHTRTDSCFPLFMLLCVSRATCTFFHLSLCSGGRSVAGLLCPQPPWGWGRLQAAQQGLACRPWVVPVAQRVCLWVLHECVSFLAGCIYTDFKGSLHPFDILVFVQCHRHSVSVLL